MTSERVYIKGWNVTQKADGKYFTPPQIIPSTGFPWQTPYKELDSSIAVSQDTFVYISNVNPLVTTGLVDLATGQLMKASPGIWQAAQDVPAATVSGYNMPQVPYPPSAPVGSVGSAGSMKGDLDQVQSGQPTVFWILWAPAPNCS